MKPRCVALCITVLLAANAAALLCALCVGAAGNTPAQALDALLGRDALLLKILVEIRLPRALMALCAGAGLAVSGAAMQGLFKNPLSDPHLLGVSSGAALGASVGIVMGLALSVAGLGGVQLCAFAGGLSTTLCVYRLARVKGRTTTVGLILAGVSMAALLSAANSLIMLINRDKLEYIMLWTMGSFTGATWPKLAWTASIALAGGVALMGFSKPLNLLLMGDEEARSMGLNVARARVTLIALSALVTSAVVASTGIISFVGLMVPHAVRAVTGPDHRAVLPVSMLGGGLLLLVVDTLARTLWAPVEIPIGILTAALGAPFFLALMRRQYR